MAAPSPNFNSVLIVTYGRTGSTLLQGLLNSIDGYYIKGENCNFIFKLFESQTRLLRAMEHGNNTSASALNSQGATHPFFGAEKHNLFLFKQDCRLLIKHQLLSVEPTPRVFGFKEVRYIDEIDNDLAGYLEFLKEVFPNPCFLILDRDFDSVKNSAWWKDGDHDILFSKIEKFRSYLSIFCVENSARCFTIDYGDIVIKNDRLKELFTFLGEFYVEDRVDAVLAMRHSY